MAGELIVVQGRKDRYGYFLMFPEHQCTDVWGDLCIECWVPREGHSDLSKYYIAHDSKPVDIAQVSSLITAYEREYGCMLRYDSGALRRLKSYAK